MRFSLLCLLMGLLCTGVRAQCPTNLIITSDRDVTDFRGNFPNCTDLPGNLEIRGPGVTDVSPLAGLKKIGGDLILFKVDMPDIKGLENITSIGNDFTITECVNLSGNGFSTGLAVSDIGGFLFVNNLPSLTSLPPLDDLGILSSGFGSNAVAIFDLAPLAGVAGNMDRVILTNNPNLRDLTGLGNVQTISSFKAKGNGGLKEIEELLKAPTDTLELTDNPQLPTCATDAVCGALANENTFVLISNNGINCSGNAAVQAMCNNCHPDYAPLVAIYNAANGDDWTDNTNWLTDCDICTWFGVTCDADDRVERLELPNNNLVGTLANEVRELTEVKWLRFNNNSFTGGVPNLIPLAKLERLRLHRAGFSGSVPILGNKPSLTHLELYDNDFGGIIPLSYSGSNFPALRFLYLDRNELTGTLPSGVTTMTNLEEFNIHTNNLTGCYPASYAALCGLNSALFFNNVGLPDGGSTDFFVNEFCANGTECAPCDHPDFAGLMEFYDATNGAGWTDNSGWADGAAGTDCEPCSWVGVTCDADERVTEIRLPMNNLTGIIPAQTSLLTALKVLQVPFNGIGGQLPDALWFNDLLEEVYVHNNNIGGQFPDIGNHPGLRIVTASNNNFFGQIPIVGSIPNMIRMMFANNDLTDGIPAGYNPTNMPDLNQFSVQGNQIFALLPEGLGDYPAGQLNINLASNNFVGCYPANYDSFCGETFRFEGNPRLPGEGSETFFTDRFCGDGIGCPLDCHPDYEVLAQVYSSTAGENWTDNTNWLTDCDVCDWFGVFCNGDGRVAALNLVNNNLVGILPDVLDGLEELIGINLSGSSGLAGAIPPSLFEIGTITSVVLADNDFTGGIPGNIGNAVTLEVLQLNNSLNLAGTLPPGLFELVNLERLSMPACGLTGTLPAGIGQLGSLTYLQLANNSLGGPLPGELGNLTGLTDLYLQQNDFQGELPAELDNLVNLTDLLLNNNDLSGCYPTEYSALCGLDRILFSGNAGLPDAGSDQFFADNFCAAGQACGPGCHPDYEALIAIYNATGGPDWTDNTGWADGAAGTDCDVCSWAGVSCFSGRVTSLSRFSMNLTGTLPEEIGQLTELRILNLPTNNIAGPLPAALGGMVELTNINLQSNGFSGEIPDLSGLPLLVNINLLANELSGPLPNWISSMTQLNRLGLSSNNLNGTVPDLTGLTDLIALFLSDNDFSGPLPVLGGKPALDALALGSNSFTGDLPDTYNAANFPVLTSLSVNGNLLEGELPAGLGGIPLLTTLYLSDNQFAGCYPASYASFCGDVADFTNNFGLPDGGSDDFFENTFCATGQTCEVALPLTWQTFNATSRPKWVELGWRTAEEINNAYFVVERSAAGGVWTDIGRIAPSAGHAYTYKDTQPLFGENYYRLRQVDHDGAFSFSEVRRVSFSAGTTLAWPNPAGEVFYLHSDIPQEIEVFDATGRQVRTIQHLGGGAQVQSGIERQGIYLLRFRTSGETVRLISK